MTKSLTIGNETFLYPDNLENPGWGEQASDWAESVTDALSDLLGDNDIALTTATIADNQSSAQNIPDLKFDVSEVISFECRYFVTRTDGATVLTESGIMTGNYNGTSWNFSHEHTGDAEVDFSITNLGQIQYFSSSMGGTYAGTISFRAKTIDQ